MLFAIHVDPATQGQGVGSALLADALGALAARGWRRAVLWVFAGNVHARRFYERGGWSCDGIERAGYIGPAKLAQLRYTHPLGPGI
ncbi:GNAT family N-acetyltransferase [Actinomycetes bacterium KLBMP 9797]